MDCIAPLRRGGDAIHQCPLDAVALCFLLTCALLMTSSHSEGCLKQYHRFVKPSFDKYIQPTLCTADIVVPRGVDNKVAMGLMLEHIRQQMALREGGVRQELLKSGAGALPTELPSTISVLDPTSQVRGMHTIIRNVETSREDFVFYSERLMRSLFEHANSFLPYEPVEVLTMNGKRFKGGGRLAKRVVGVSILTSGMSMEVSEMHHDSLSHTHARATLPTHHQRHSHKPIKLFGAL